MYVVEWIIFEGINSTWYIALLGTRFFLYVRERIPSLPQINRLNPNRNQRAGFVTSHGRSYAFEAQLLRGEQSDPLR